MWLQKMSWIIQASDLSDDIVIVKCVSQLLFKHTKKNSALCSKLFKSEKTMHKFILHIRFWQLLLRWQHNFQLFIFLLHANRERQISSWGSEGPGWSMKGDLQLFILRLLRRKPARRRQCMRDKSGRRHCMCMACDMTICARTGCEFWRWNTKCCLVLQIR